MTDRHVNRKELLDRRRELRQNQTYAERCLWSQLRARKHGVKFKRQHSVGNFILDFYCPELRLCIEVDGASHDDPKVREYDAYRQRRLEAEGITVIRFTDSQVINEANPTLETIDRVVTEMLQTRTGDRGSSETAGQSV